MDKVKVECDIFPDIFGRERNGGGVERGAKLVAYLTACWRRKSLLDKFDEQPSYCCLIAIRGPSYCHNHDLVCFLFEPGREGCWVIRSSKRQEKLIWRPN